MNSGSPGQTNGCLSLARGPEQIVWAWREAQRFRKLLCPPNMSAFWTDSSTKVWKYGSNMVLGELVPEQKEIKALYALSPRILTVVQSQRGCWVPEIVLYLFYLLLYIYVCVVCMYLSWGVNGSRSVSHLSDKNPTWSHHRNLSVMKEKDVGARWNFRGAGLTPRTMTGWEALGKPRSPQASVFS